MEKLMESEQQPAIPKVGDLVECDVLSVSKNEVLLDIDGLTTGIVRGRELIDESGIYSNIKTSDKVKATVIDMENERGHMELSFRFVGHKKAWDDLHALYKKGDVVSVPVSEANRGGLMVKVGNIEGFLPVSQLTVDHYPRVEGGDKSKILEILNNYIGQDFKVRIIDVDEVDSKLIVSERAAWEEKQKAAMSKYKVGDIVDGQITGVVDFGAFVEFGDNLEGLIHISELAWQRIDNPSDFVNVGEKVKCKIISIDNSKISLSIKALQKDPWVAASKKYTIGQVIKGKVLKINPFGIFVELDKEIHGLAHISELSEKRINNPSEVVKEGKEYSFKILSVEPDNHRLGLSLKALKDKTVKDKGDSESSSREKQDKKNPPEEKKPAKIEKKEDKKSK